MDADHSRTAYRKRSGPAAAACRLFGAALLPLLFAAATALPLPAALADDHRDAGPVKAVEMPPVDSLQLFRPDDGPMSHGEIYSDEIITREFRLYQGQPFADPRLAFRLLVPAKWTAEPVPPRENPALMPWTATRIASFRGPETPAGTPFLSLDAYQLEHEVTAIDWMRAILFPHGYEPVLIRAWDNHHAEAEISFTGPREQGFRGRALVLINGNIVHFLHCGTPTVLYREQQDRYGLITGSLALPTPSRDTIEPVFSLNTGDGLNWEYPASWQPGEIVTLADGQGQAMAELFNLNDIGEFDGLIRLDILRKGNGKTAEKALEDLHHRLDDFGITTEEPLPEDEQTLSDVPEKASLARGEGVKLEVLNGTSNNMTGPQEVWILTRDSKKHFRSLVLVTPGRHEFPISWARNRRALEIMASAWASKTGK